MKKKYLRNGMIVCELKIGEAVYMLLGDETEIAAQAQEIVNKTMKGLM